MKRHVGDANGDGLQVVVQHNWTTETLDFYVFRKLVDGRQILRQHADQLLGGWEPLVDGVDAAPSFRIPVDAWTIMLRAAEGMVEPSAAGERHLADTIAVRDRLLTLVELSTASLLREPEQRIVRQLDS